MNYENIELKTDKIVENLYNLNNNISKIKRKIGMINKIYNKLEKNKVLKQENKNNKLLFQTNILKNEFSYYKTIYDQILDKYSKEIYELLEYILIILISLNKIEIDNESAKNNIFSKIIYTRKLTSVSFGKLSEIINNIINNLKLVDQFIKLFNTYLNSLSRRNNRDNIHNNNFELDAKYKKENILLEYNKYCDKFIKVIDYFKECSDSVIDQIETSKLLKFFLKYKE
jgi:hypothetical protein